MYRASDALVPSFAASIFSRPRNAPREIRTPTVQTDHKALNLARLPVPPQARAPLSIEPGLAGVDAVRVGGYSANTCSDYVIQHGYGGRSDGRPEPHQAAAGNLRLRQGATGASTAIRRRFATSARPSASPRPRRCTRTWPTSRSSGCFGAIRPSRGRSRCWWTRPRRRWPRTACRSSDRSRPASRSSPRRTSRST